MSEPNGSSSAALDQERVNERHSRRRFFALGASLAAASVALPRQSKAQQSQGRSAARGMVKRLLNETPDPNFNPFKKQPTTSAGWDSTLTRLVRRVTNGITQDEVQLAKKLGFHGYLNYHLSPSKIDDRQTQNFVGNSYPLLSQTVDELYNLDQNDTMNQLIESSVYRAAFSKRQLYERMVEFWSDHFNIAWNEVRYLKVVDDRDVIRKHALGKFGDLLKASAHSPAMLEYLDNTRNRRTTLNENYAREIMELHTMGADGGYTQTDVRELARCLTGWTMSGRGVFNFDPNGHDFGEKTVLGQTIPSMPASAGEQGKEDGDFMLDVILAHPSTARFVSRKMLRFLLQYDPSPAQVDAVAAVYTATKGDIPSMVRAVLSPGNLNASPPKYRRPYTFVLAALRGVVNPGAVAQVTTVAGRYLRNLGQPMFGWQPPDGYPDRADYWAGGVQQRWNFATYITTTNSAEMSMELSRFYNGQEGAVNTPESVINGVSRHLFGGEMPERLRAQLMTYLSAGNLSVNRAREGVALAISSSTFQWV